MVATNSPEISDPEQVENASGTTPTPIASPTSVSLSYALFEVRKQFNLLTEPHTSDLWRYCLHLTHSAWDAEDLMQDTLAKAFARLSTIFQPMDMKPYLFRIASNTWIDHLRRQKLELDDLDPSDDRETLLHEDQEADPLALQAAIEQLITVLPTRQRIAYLLSDVYDFSLAEVAQQLNISVGAAKSLLHRARATILTRSHEKTAETLSRAEVVEVIDQPEDELVRRYLDAFNRHDLDALVALLHPDVSSDIVGVFVQEGRDYIRDSSLKAWYMDKRPQWVKYGRYAGRPAFFVFVNDEKHEGRECLGWLVTVETREAQIVAITDYYYSPDLVRYLAEKMGVPALPNMLTEL